MYPHILLQLLTKGIDGIEKHDDRIQCIDTHMRSRCCMRRFSRIAELKPVNGKNDQICVVLCTPMKHQACINSFEPTLPDHDALGIHGLLCGRPHANDLTAQLVAQLPEGERRIHTRRSDDVMMACVPHFWKCIIFGDKRNGWPRLFCIELSSKCGLQPPRTFLYIETLLLQCTCYVLNRFNLLTAQFGMIEDMVSHFNDLRLH